jgi:hypothetical protein
VRYVPVGKPGDPNGLVAKGEDGSIIDKSAPVHGITGRVAEYDLVEVGAFSSQLLFGGGQSGGIFAEVRAGLESAQEELSDRRSFSQDCVDGLKKIGVSPYDLSDAATSVIIVNGPGSSKRVRDAYGSQGIAAQVGNAAQTVWDEQYSKYLENNDLPHMRVQDIFSVSPGVSAWTPFGGSSIYVNASLINNADPGNDQALIMHELLHNLYGLDDGEIQDKLGIGRSVPSVAITTWLRNNCVYGMGNDTAAVKR